MFLNQGILESLSIATACYTPALRLERRDVLLSPNAWAGCQM